MSASYNIASGLGALAYDAKDNLIFAGYGGGDTQGEIYEIQLSASKAVMSSAGIFNTCAFSCLTSIDDGLAYDAGTSTLYFSPDTATTIWHLSTTGSVLGSFPWIGTSCYNSGLSIGDQLLFEGSDGCTTIYVVDKATPGTLDFSFSTGGTRDEGLACDDVTFGQDAIWSKDAYTPIAYAFAIPSGSCGVGGEPAESFTANFGEQFTGLVAKLQPSGGAGSLADQSATIAWGDGSITRATLSIPSGSITELDVSGTHTYWTAGSLPVVISLSNGQGAQTFGVSALVKSRYAALGDSYSSGEGAGWPPGQPPIIPGCNNSLYQDVRGNPANTDHIDGAQQEFIPSLIRTACDSGFLSTTLQGNTCHRAITAYSHVVDSLLAVQGITLDLVACSGAVVQDAYSSADEVHNDQLHTGEGAQVGALGPNVSLITLTFGGNNLHFAGIASQCVSNSLMQDAADCVKQDDSILQGLGYDTSLGKPTDGVFKPRHSTGVQFEPGNLSLAGLIDNSDRILGPCANNLKAQCLDLHDALVLLFRALKADAPGARILVLGYPAFFPPNGTGDTCEHFLAFDQPWVNDRILLTDQIIEDAVLESGVAQYVDVYRALAGHEECTGDASFTVNQDTGQVTGCSAQGRWINGIDIPSATLAGSIGTQESLHPNPCGHLAEGQEVASAYGSQPAIDSFSIDVGQSHMTTINVASGPGIDRVNFTTIWSSGDLQLTLQDPSGTTYSPVQQGPVYAMWDIPHPSGGVWTLTAKNVTTGDLGVVRGSVSLEYNAIPFLPPAGVITVKTPGSCGLLGCSATFAASVNQAVSNEVASYQWFDDHGNLVASGSTATLPSRINRYKMILRTIGTDGEVRYTVACSDGSTVTIATPTSSSC